jgi:hypothetical protein
MGAGGYLTLDMISWIKTWAKTGNNRAQTPFRPVKIDGKDYYVLIVHPDCMYDLKTLSAWQQAMREAEVRGKENPLFTNASAVWNGVIELSITINQAICGKLLLSFDYREVKMSEIKTIRREDFDCDLAWLAGLIDGEGNINIGFYNNGSGPKWKGWKVFRISLSISNTNAFIIQKATEILARMNCFFKPCLRNRKESELPTFNLFLNGQRNTVRALTMLLPFLVGKKELAKQAIYAFDYRNKLRRAGNNQHTQKHSRVQDNPVLHRMIDRARELVSFRPDPFGFSRKASESMRVKRPSESIRLAALSADDVLRTLPKGREPGRNDPVAAKAVVTN